MESELFIPFKFPIGYDYTELMNKYKLPTIQIHDITYCEMPTNNNGIEDMKIILALFNKSLSGNVDFFAKDADEKAAKATTKLSVDELNLIIDWFNNYEPTNTWTALKAHDGNHDIVYAYNINNTHKIMSINEGGGIRMQNLSDTEFREKLNDIYDYLKRNKININK